ncbi:MAG: putative capsid protein [Circoviridae sp.]|nr:MAG: putative capsid protein [Circoviridae sp.]
MVARYKKKSRRYSKGRKKIFRKRGSYRRMRVYRKKRLNRRKLNKRQMWPLTQVAKMNYHTVISIACGSANVPYIYEMRANSIYDPDKTGSGHQPSNRDKWAAIYSEYCVIGAKITVQYVRTAINASQGYFNVYTSNDVTNRPSSLDAWMEYKNGKNLKPCGSTMDDYYNKCHAFYSANKWFKKKVMTSGENWTAMNADPVDVVEFLITAATINTTGAYTFDVFVEYTVAMRNRIEDNTLQ